MKKFANGDCTDGGWAQAAKGLWPRPYVINAGTFLYRFIDISRQPSALAADGPWWFDYQDYQSIKHFAERNGYSLGYTARIFAAVLYEWSNVNAVIRAQVVAGPLTAWKGKGKQVTPTGRDPRDINAKMTPMQGPSEVSQIYIPGLGQPHRNFSKYMRLVSSDQISTA